jgi:hypothetical protein
VLGETNSTAARVAASSTKTTENPTTVATNRDCCCCYLLLLIELEPPANHRPRALAATSQEEADVSLPKEREIQTTPRLLLPADHSISSDIFD